MRYFSLFSLLLLILPFPHLVNHKRKRRRKIRETCNYPRGIIVIVSVSPKKIFLENSLNFGFFPRKRKANRSRCSGGREILYVKREEEGVVIYCCHYSSSPQRCFSLFPLIPPPICESMKTLNFPPFSSFSAAVNRQFSPSSPLTENEGKLRSEEAEKNIYTILILQKAGKWGLCVCGKINFCFSSPPALYSGCPGQKMAFFLSRFFARKKKETKVFFLSQPNPREFLLLREVQRFLFYPQLINLFRHFAVAAFCFLKHCYLLGKQFVSIAAKNQNIFIFQSEIRVSANSQHTPPFPPTQPNPDENFPSSSLLSPRGIFTLPQPTFFIFPSIVRKFLRRSIFEVGSLRQRRRASSKLCGKAEGVESIVAQNIIRNGCHTISDEKALALFCEIVKHSQVAEQKLVSFLVIGYHL